MRTKEQRKQDNAAYLRRQKAIGIINTSFMLPAAIRNDVKEALLGVVWVNFGGQDTFQGLFDGLQCASGPPEKWLRFVDG